MTTRVETAVIGGGIIGVCIAYALASEGRAVTVLEREDICAIGGSTHSNAGLLTPSDIYPLASPGALGKGMRWLFDSTSPFYIAPQARPRLGRWLWMFMRASAKERSDRVMPVQRALLRRSADLWAEFAALPGVDFGYQQRGWLWVYNDEQALEAGVTEAAEAARFGSVSAAWDAGQVREALPNVAPGVVGGVYYAEDGHCDPRRAVEEVARMAAAGGAELRPHTEVLDIEMDGRRVTRLVTTAGVIEADTVVLATGAWSPLLARRLGFDLPIEAAKGYGITVERPADMPELPAYGGSSYVCVTPMGERLRLAGTLELAGLDLGIRWKRVDAIRRGAGMVVAGAERLEPLALWRGLRPCTPDGLPVIGRSPRHDNLIVAAGHCMLGLGMGPVTGTLVADLVAEREPAIDLDPLRVDRFAELARPPRPRPIVASAS
ncbi:MAG TPA: FAD-dependent oxidoreductase [Thermoleophilia bacterium]|nr:FAD-dependent oxidoreductase [Thermoleophilia bacterium]